MENIDTTSAILKRANDAVTTSRRRLAKGAAAAVIASAANTDKHRAQYTKEDAQMEEAKENTIEVADILSTLQTNMETKKEGADNQGHNDWIRNITAKTKKFRNGRYFQK